MYILSTKINLLGLTHHIHQRKLNSFRYWTMIISNQKIHKHIHLHAYTVKCIVMSVIWKIKYYSSNICKRKPHPCFFFSLKVHVVSFVNLFWTQKFWRLPLYVGMWDFFLGLYEYVAEKGEVRGWVAKKWRDKSNEIIEALWHFLRTYFLFVYLFFVTCLYILI